MYKSNYVIPISNTLNRIFLIFQCNIQLKANIALAQAKQKKDYFQKMRKGVKVFSFKEDDMVF